MGCGVMGRVGCFEVRCQSFLDACVRFTTFQLRQCEHGSRCGPLLCTLMLLCVPLYPRGRCVSLIYGGVYARLLSTPEMFPVSTPAVPHR